MNSQFIHTHMETQPKKVLVVDDEKDLRDAMVTALSYEGFEVSSAADGVEGFTMAHEVRPDIILLDIVMPKRDGIETLRALRAEEWGKKVPVIVMTVLDDMEKIAEAIEAGAQEYVVKSEVALGAIVTKVKNRLARS
jgi:two-component system OmpR family response regulator